MWRHPPSCHSQCCWCCFCLLGSWITNDVIVSIKKYLIKVSLPANADRVRPPVPLRVSCPDSISHGDNVDRDGDTLGASLAPDSFIIALVSTNFI